ncbi:MAG: hypothetical protein RMZ41_003100 [Nostoc sp. DedVER02]|uniref:hypothetical protein n=1 Tax=unclassified Nostoc TaxID=2593658 RepID=UPI002AD3CDA8|nr:MULTISPECIES: hypothetical protein [unclassified Nostoc]MDZ7986857.1 hypothetical protein [Nostoc sp. DedVER02]MDZ8115759.1 hypothetical protein [Nostoc sp. DedVER01b]
MHNTKIRGVIADIFRAGAITSLWGASFLGSAAIGFYGIEIIAANVNLNVTRAYNWQGLKNGCVGGSLVAISSFLGNAVIGTAIHEDEEEDE